MMAEWSKAFLLTFSRISILPGFESGACEKPTSDFGLGDVIRRPLRLPPQLTTGYSWLIRNMAEKVTKIKIPKDNQKIKYRVKKYLKKKK